MASVAEVLHRFGVRADEQQIAEVLEQLLAEHLCPLRGGAGLPRRERELLAAGGLRFDDPAALDRAATETTAALAGWLADAVSVREVAAALGVDASRIRHRIGAGALYTLPAGRGRARLIPTFQLDDAGRPLPGLAGVLGALPTDLHPLEVAGFFTTPRPDLTVGGKALSPREWLAAGGEPAAVVALARGLALVGS